jgi:pyroglutamyl-peptidase
MLAAVMAGARILLTGFVPFGKHGVNASERVVRALARRAPAGVELETMVLPVVFGEAFAKLRARLDAGPALDAVVLTGMAARASRVRLERVALNLADAESFARGRRPVPRPDNAGRAPVDETIEPDGPLARGATVDVKRLGRALLAQGLPVELSLSAGSYVCNDLYYRTLAHLAGRAGAPACLFVHVPELPRRVPLKVFGVKVPLVMRRVRKALGLEVQVRTVGALLAALAHDLSLARS